MSARIIIGYALAFALGCFIAWAYYFIAAAVIAPTF